MRYLFVALISIVISSVVTALAIRISAVLDREAANSAQFALFDKTKKLLSDYKKEGAYVAERVLIWHNNLISNEKQILKRSADF
jgi:hypothetical protein